jgi:hypothetical protein
MGILKVSIFSLMLGLFIGFFLVYVTTPTPKIVFKYPTIDNITNTTFVDDSNVCHKYYAIEIPCSNSQNNHQKDN